jgi:hypothetical protein
MSRSLGQPDIGGPRIAVAHPKLTASRDDLVNHALQSLPNAKTIR